jgi:hypothetical protein
MKPASPGEISAFLGAAFTKESLLEYQQKVVEAACVEAVRELGYAMEYRPQDEYYDGFTAATERMDPQDVFWSGPFPADVVTFD